jgi:hypothetical protein
MPSARRLTNETRPQSSSSVIRQSDAWRLGELERNGLEDRRGKIPGRPAAYVACAGRATATATWRGEEQQVAATATGTNSSLGVTGLRFPLEQKLPPFSTFPNAPPYLLPSRSLPGLRATNHARR